MFTKIIHMHLAKTAGTSINRWLDLLTSAGRVRPADQDSRFFAPRLQGQAWAWPFSETGMPLHAELGRESRAYWDVMHGHSIGLMTKHPSAYRFVILRDPTSRLLSFLRDWRRLHPSEAEALQGDAREVRRDALRGDASQFVTKHAGSAYFRGMSQAHVLKEIALHLLPETARRESGATSLELARLALDELFDFVGVFEDLPAAVRCIARDIGAAPPADVGQANAGRAEASRDALSPEALARLREVWADDYAIHEHAGRLARGFASADYDEAAFERGHLMTRLAQLSPSYTGWGRGFSVNDQLVGSGFHGRESANTAGVQAWTGPGTRSVIYVPVPADERLDLFLDVAGYADPRVRDSLRVRVDGREAGFARREAAGVSERIWIRTTTSRPFVKLEILVDRCYSADELGAGTDRRRRGLAVRGYGYRIVPGIDPGTEKWPGEFMGAAAVGEPLSDERHPDHEWAVAFARRALGQISPDRTEDEVLGIVTSGISGRDLRSRVTAAGIEEAFRRVLRRPPPQEWVDFWVGKRFLTLRRLYQDLIRGEEFRQRRQRLG
jgi:hypothetical protein